MLPRFKRRRSMRIATISLTLLAASISAPTATADEWPFGTSEEITANPIEIEEPATADQRRAQVALDTELEFLGILHSIDQDLYDELLVQESERKDDSSSARDIISHILNSDVEMPSIMRDGGAVASIEPILDVFPGRVFWGWRQYVDIDEPYDRDYPQDWEIYRASDDELITTDTNWQAGCEPYDVMRLYCFSRMLDGPFERGVSYYAKIYFNGRHQMTTEPITAIGAPGIPSGMAGNCVCDYQQRIADPVNTATGEVVEDLTDVTVAGAGVPFSVRRHYRSNDSNTTGLLGQGWSIGLESRLEFGADGDEIVLVDPDGARVNFTRSGESYISPRPVRYRLEEVSGGFRVSASDDSARTFNNAGQLTRVEDRAGSGIALSYQAGILSSVTDAAGRAATFSVNSAGRLEKIDLADGRSMSFKYSSGQLSEVVGVDGGSQGYAYDESGRLATITDAMGETITRNVYDEETGRIIEQTDPAGGVWNFEWVPTADAPEHTGTSNVTDPSGGIWTDIYSAGVLTRSYDPLRRGPVRAYDSDLNVARITDARNTQASLVHDESGKLLSSTIDGVTQSWTYDEEGNPNSYTDGLGAETTYTYAEGLLVRAAGAAGESRFSYNSAGQIASETTPAGRTTSYEYDGFGNRTAEVGPAGGRTTFTYDEAGRVLSRITPLGNEAGADPADHTTHFSYDSSGRLETVTDAEGNSTSHTYDANGNLLTITDAAGNVTSYTYDPAGRQTSVTNAEGGVSRTAYDYAGNIVSETDPMGNMTTYAYNAANRMIAMTTPQGNEAGANPEDFTTIYGYDANGNQTVTVGPTGSVTLTAFDVFNRPVQVTDGTNRSTKASYDEAGNVVSVTAADGGVSTSTYDAAGRLVETMDQTGGVTSYTHDEDGNILSKVTPLNFRTSWTYDSEGRVVSETEARGHVEGADPADFTTTYTYDAEGNLTSVTDPLGNTSTTSYDSVGRPIATTDPLGATTRYAHDGLGRTAQVTSPDGGITTYSYNATGQLTTRRDANGNSTSYTYDEAGRQITITDPLGREQQFGYNADGHQVSVTNARGIVTDITVDARGLVTDISYSDETPDVSYTYDWAGRQSSITDGTGTRFIGRDEAGRLEVIGNSDFAFAYEYDAAGRITKRMFPNGQATEYSYDADGRVTSQSTRGETITFEYDAASHLIRKTLPEGNGHVETRSYDNSGQLIGTANVRGDEALSSWNATLDSAGRPVEIAVTREGNPEPTQQYGYDLAGRLTSWCSFSGNSADCDDTSDIVSYTYDKVGNRLAMESNGAQVTYSYDEADQLLAMIDGENSQSFSHDADGNRTDIGNNSVVYDANNRPLSAAWSGEQYSFVNDDQGNRIRTERDGAVENINYWDINHPLPQLALIRDGDDENLGSYTVDPLGLPLTSHTADETLYSHTDRLGSVTDVTDADGALLGRYDYEPFGARTGDTGEGEAALTPFGFTGQLEDRALNGQLDFRARTYDPASGRFTSRDPIELRMTHPHQSAYVYVGNAATYLVDPSGMDGCPPGSLPVTGGVCTNPGAIGSDPSPVEVGLDWLSGLGPRTQLFGPGSRMVEELKRDYSMTVIRGRVSGKIAQGKQRGSEPYNILAEEGSARFVKDALAVLTYGKTAHLESARTGGLHGSLTALYIGSYVAKWRVSEMRTSPWEAGVEFEVLNDTTVDSLIHPPTPALRDFWDECGIGEAINGFMDWVNGPMATQSQILRWSEWVPIVI
ncbi:RHS repeat-associated core domain-containing protein [Streptomyces harbinensis]|uniref:DUF6531 domain-containing protein n=1 Tax=Streptomyces harbinensis TaxID=1176198 RepID=UPI00158FC52B|nr:DUF6531 domain-containing protein [Streptomyces harbinensis]QKV67681.1 RHS repeat-associated core domain-containing protein [Streptomyces harbinensis]